MSVSTTFGDKADVATRSGRGLDDLFAEHAPQAGKLAYLLTGDRHLAEDIVQEAFVKLTGRFDHIRNRDAFPSYLRQTIVNLARGHFRRQSVERRYLDRNSGGHFHDAIPDLEGRSALMEALDRLPQRQRAAVVLRHYNDLSERQVADLLGCSVGNVKSLTSRGLATLRSHLKGLS